VKINFSKKRNAAMTLFEVGVVIAIVVILAVVFIPILSQSRQRPKRIQCANQLKQISVAYKVWVGDGDHFPMGDSIARGGSMEMAQTGNVVQTFLVMSNELSNPQLLVCPADETRTAALNFRTTLVNSNISYLVGVDVRNDANPQMILSGDCNFEMGGMPVKAGLNSFWTNDPVAWQAIRHITSGNIGLADGSVQPMTSSNLQDCFQQTGFATNRFAIP
jgi:type II secretory pathway pseudopilin PulG